MDDRYLRPCFDSSVFLGGLNEEIANGIKRGVVFRHVWQKAKDGDFPVLISAITIAEVYKKKKRVTPSTGVLDEFLQCIDETFVQVIEVDRETALAAHALCRRFSAEKLMPNDGIVLACALRAGCDVLLAWDEPLVSVKHESIRIEPPAMIGRNLLTPSEIASSEEIRDYEKERAKTSDSKTSGLPRSGVSPS